MNYYENENDWLQHYGVMGMKWGVRHDQKKYEKKIDKLQKKNRKLSDEWKKNKAVNDKKKLNKIEDKQKQTNTKIQETKRKLQISKEREVPSVKDMTYKEIQQKINRIEIENKYNNLVQRNSLISKGKRIVSRAVENFAKDSANYVEKRAFNDAKQGFENREKQRKANGENTIFKYDMPKNNNRNRNRNRNRRRY